MSSAYELERLKNIQRNKERLKELGLLDANESVSDVVSLYTRYLVHVRHQIICLRVLEIHGPRCQEASRE